MPKSKVLPFKIGCDPEFILHLPDKVVSSYTAQDFVHFGVTNEFGNLGTDAGGLCEVRPAPSNTILGLARNLKGIFKQVQDKLGIFDWSTLSTNPHQTAGGHIHLEIPNSMLKNWDNPYSGRYPNKVYEYRRQMYSFYLPLWLAENQENARTRSRSGYGHIGDFRVEQHSHKGKNAYTFELRAPTAEWLTSPKAMIATFAYVATVHNEILNHPENIAKFSDFICKTDEEFATIERIASDNVALFIEPLLKKIKKAIKTFEFYERFRVEINWFLNAEKVRAEKESHKYNILKGWGLEPKVPSLAQIRSQKIFANRMKAFQTSVYNQSSQALNPFKFNGDLGVSEFVHSLAKASYAYHWKFQNKFLFFGIRKDIKGAIVANNEFQIVSGQEFLDDNEKKGLAKNALQKMYTKYQPDEHTWLIGLPKPLRKSQNMQEFFEFMHLLQKQLQEEPLANAMDLRTVELVKPEKKEKATNEIPF